MQKNINQIETMRKNLKLLREKKNWSIEKLSEKSGIEIKVLTGIEGDADFSIDCLFTLCRIYHIKVYEIFLPIEMHSH